MLRNFRNALAFIFFGFIIPYFYLNGLLPFLPWEERTFLGKNLDKVKLYEKWTLIIVVLVTFIGLFKFILHFYVSSKRRENPSLPSIFIDALTALGGLFMVFTMKYPCILLLSAGFVYIPGSIELVIDFRDNLPNKYWETWKDQVARYLFTLESKKGISSRRAWIAAFAVKSVTGFCWVVLFWTASSICLHFGWRGRFWLLLSMGLLYSLYTAFFWAKWLKINFEEGNNILSVFNLKRALQKLIY